MKTAFEPDGYVAVLEESLSEWNSDEDEDAWRGLQGSGLIDFEQRGDH